MDPTIQPSSGNVFADPGFGPEEAEHLRISSGLMIALLACLAVLLAMSCAELEPPERPASVTKDAIWAGGSDGGAWIDCVMSTKEPLTIFRCTVFHEDGDTWVSGRSFALVDRSADGEISLFEGPFHRVEPISFDGDIIDVHGSRVLVPEEWIERIGRDVTNWRVVWPNTQGDK